MVKYIYITNKKLFFVRIPLIILQIISPILNIYFVRLILNAITLRTDISGILFITASMAGANFVVSLLIKIISKIDSQQAEQTIYKIKLQLGTTITKMQFHDIEQPKVKDFVGLAQSDDLFVKVVSNITNLFTSLLNVLIYASIILFIQPWIILLIFCSVITQLIINKMKLNVDNKWRIKQIPVLRKLWYIEELLCDPRYGKELRVNLLKPWLTKKTTDQYENHCIPIVKSNACEINGLSFISEFLKISENIIVYLLLTYKVIFKNITIGDYSFYLASTFNLTSVLSNFIDNLSELFRDGTFINEFRLCIDLAEKSYSSYGNIQIDEHTSPCIEFKNVSFKYPNTDNYVLKNISFKIKSGEKISIVGVNGSGKTTLVKLICRFYEPSQGEILINGINIYKISQASYLKVLGVVFQDYKLFSFSIFENITLGQKVDKNKLKYSIENSNLDKKINSLPQKEFTFIYKDFDEQGVELSGGEGQKLAIARALYKDSPLIILDEPTAALDPIAEYEVLKQFESLSKGKTSIYISHRLSSTRFSDKILVLQNGFLCEYGSHDELINMPKGIYRTMFEIQAKYYEK